MVRPEDIPSATNFPLGQPPPGVVVNFEHPVDSLEPIYMKVAAACLPLMFLFICARVIARVTGNKKQGSWLNDIIFGVAVVVTAAYIIVLSLQIARGVVGRYSYEILLLQYTGWNLRMEHTNDVFYTFSIMFIKLGIALFYLDTFGRLRWMKFSIYGFLPTLVAFHFSAFVVYTAMCEAKGKTPIEQLLSVAARSCSEGILNFVVAQASFHAITDVFLLVLPLPALWSLHLPLKQKIGVMAMFSTGSVAVIASLISLSFRIRVRQNVTNALRNEAWTAMAAVIEVTAGMMVLCMPAITTLSRKWSPYLRSQLSSIHSTLNKSHKSTGATGSYASKVSYPSDTDSGTGIALSNSSMSYEASDEVRYCYSCGSAADKTNKTDNLKNLDSITIKPCHSCRGVSEKKQQIKVSEVHITRPERSRSSMTIRKQIDFTVEREPSLK